MADFTVTRIDPALAATERAHWEQPRQGASQYPRPPRRPSRLSPLIAGAIGDVDPEECEMVYEFDGLGRIVGLTVRNVRTQATVARFDLAQLTQLVATTGQRGVLFERRG